MVVWRGRAMWLFSLSSVKFKILHHVDIYYEQVWMTNQWIYWWRHIYCMNTGLTYICKMKVVKLILVKKLNMSFKFEFQSDCNAEEIFFLTVWLLLDVAFNSLEHKPSLQLLLYPNTNQVGVVCISPLLSMPLRWSLSQQNL